MSEAFPELALKLCFGTTVPDQIESLEDLCAVPCELNALPDIPLDPDQRDVQFPPILPPRDISRLLRTRCVPGAPPGGMPLSVGPTDLGDAVSNLDPMSDNWERLNDPDADVYSQEVLMTRIAFDETAEKIVVFFRTKEYDSCGNLIRISEETAQDFTDTGPCSN